jgi:sarcosine oxidase delta subunit
MRGVCYAKLNNLFVDRRYWISFSTEYSVIMWSEFVWLRTGKIGRLLWKWVRTFKCEKYVNMLLASSTAQHNSTGNLFHVVIRQLSTYSLS